MPVVITEIVTEVVLAPEAGAASGGASAAGAGLSPEQLDAVVRRATERVVEILRREWDR
ncbi:hypothetical protein LRP67_19980 [Nocardioides sp. cx-169]|uniref:hypothetical protein n=1 Tax=Nocardioides sp. cx-169 TaxID=2899080 RepID=UPI001E535059|nr:hypothetical protein [Nocardioides sp. cx-169]MCD4536378.1 hypothetical protein [Nocardioides sp. cx-169]